jgi:ribonucleoside-diphosphate reductase alpha chain
MQQSSIGIAEGIELSLQAASVDTWQTKYQLRSKEGVILDTNVDDTFRRVAKALADNEIEDQAKWEEQFYWAMRHGAIPAGRILANAGAGEHKPHTSTINCTVSGTIPDSMDGILTKLREAGLTLAAGCGIGYDFSTLRPRGAFVAGVGAKTSGAVSFMGIYDAMCFTVASAGGRRGAQMGTMLITHPSIREFIQAKRQAGTLRQFNLSVLITEDFMKAVDNDGTIDLWFPHNKKESREGHQFVYHKWPYFDQSMTRGPDETVLCKVYETISARELWDMIMLSNYEYAEPGFILIDKVNEENNLWFCENIRTANPCGEQMLPPYGSCLLGSVNLTKFVRHPFEQKAYFDYTHFADVVRVFTRMLDNVVEINGLPLPEQRTEIHRKRRHGMGFLGLGSALTMLCVRYGSEQAQRIAREIAQVMALAGWEAGIALGHEKGVPDALADLFPDKAGVMRRGHELMAQSAYMRRLEMSSPEGAQVVKAIREKGARFSHHTSIAPTGTIALSVANNVSNGIEPSFQHLYTRNVIKEGKKTKEHMSVYSYEYLLYCELHNLDPDLPETVANLPRYFAVSDTITPLEHLLMQAAVQPYVDSAISKTVNVPTDISFEAFKDIYLAAWRNGLKGCSTFRFNPAAFQGVLVKEEDLANTTYRFTLTDGSVVDLRGNDEIEYEGCVHRAANLFDAIKEGYYGKL